MFFSVFGCTSLLNLNIMSFSFFPFKEYCHKTECQVCVYIGERVLKLKVCFERNSKHTHISLLSEQPGAFRFGERFTTRGNAQQYLRDLNNAVQNGVSTSM